MSDLRELVRAERRRHGWSVRQAAQAGGCSNTTWGEWEDGKRELGPAAQAAVSQAFEWPLDWPDNPPEPITSPATVSQQLDDHETRLARLEQALLGLQTMARDAQQVTKAAAKRQQRRGGGTSAR